VSTRGGSCIGLEEHVLTSPLDDNMTPEEMFGVNADALLKVKREYDPEDVFNKLNPLGLSG
jgi:FAD/FMN-containing dehydrogenase